MQVITTTDALAAVCQAFAEHPFVTVDTEFMRERTYWSQLCLVQLARPAAEGETGAEGSVIVDPLAEGIDLGPLFDLMRDRTTVKVFHAARQDVEIFWNLTDAIPEPLFDTQIAAMVCGYGDQVGYETLVRRIARVDLDKSSRFTDWSRRPLSDKQLAYAAGDVTHLREIYRALDAELARSGRAHWLTEEMAILTDPGTYRNDPAEAWRRVKARSASPKVLAVIRALADWREATAQARDVPRSRLIKDDALIEIANARPQSVEDLGKLRLVQREVRKPETAAEVLAAVQAGLAVPQDQRPKPQASPRRREGSGAVADMLKVLLKARADELGVASKLIAQTSDLEALAGEENPDIPLLRGWRREVFGEDALRLCRGEIGLQVGPTGVKVVEMSDDAAAG